MNLLAGYGSDDDDENTCEVQQTAAPSLNSEGNDNRTIKSSTIDVERKQTAKPKKKFDIGYLPPAIMAALARGDSAADSDDDDFPVATAYVQTSVNGSKDNGSDFSSPLLSMLPAPKQQNDKPAVAPLYKDVNRPAAEQPKPKPTFNFSYVQQTVKSTSSNVDVDVHKVNTVSNPTDSLAD